MRATNEGVIEEGSKEGARREKKREKSEGRIREGARVTCTCKVFVRNTYSSRCKNHSISCVLSGNDVEPPALHDKRRLFGCDGL